MPDMSDRELEIRGKLVRSLSAMREMLPGSLVERARKCGKPNCHCADGKQLHTQFLLSLSWHGEVKTFHIPAEFVDEVRDKVETYKRFQQAASAICEMNLRRFLRRKGGKEKI
jgi:hypothetical protein